MHRSTKAQMDRRTGGQRWMYRWRRYYHLDSESMDIVRSEASSEKKKKRKEKKRRKRDVYRDALMHSNLVLTKILLQAAYTE